MLVLALKVSTRHIFFQIKAAFKMKVGAECAREPLLDYQRPITRVITYNMTANACPHTKKKGLRARFHRNILRRGVFVIQ